MVDAAVTEKSPSSCAFTLALAAAYVSISTVLFFEVFPVLFVGGAPATEIFPPIAAPTVLDNAHGALPWIASVARWVALQRIARHVVTVGVVLLTLYAAASRRQWALCAMHACAWLGLLYCYVNIHAVLVVTV